MSVEYLVRTTPWLGSFGMATRVELSMRNSMPFDIFYDADPPCRTLDSYHRLIAPY